MIGKRRGIETGLTDRRAPRVGNVVLGLWLFLSGLLWPHESGPFVQAIVLGFLVVLFAILGLRGRRWARYVNGVLGAALFVSSLLQAPDLGPATLVNNLTVAVGVLLLARMPGVPVPGAPTGRCLRAPLRLIPRVRRSVPAPAR
jgi:hypothetical protein